MNKANTRPAAVRRMGWQNMMAATLWGAMALGAGAQDEDGSILFNGGFENGKAKWWGPAVTEDGLSDAKPATGGHCLKIVRGYACQDKIAITGGKRYKVSMKIRCDGATDGSVYVQLSYRGDGMAPAWYGPEKVHVGGHTERALFVTGGTEEWKDFEAIVETPDGADQMLIYLRKLDDSEGASYYDDVKVVPTDEEVTEG